MATKRKPFKTRKPTDEVKKHQILVLQGQDKTGKTHMACTGPSPCILVNTDQGDKGVVMPSKFPGKDIEILDIAPGSQLVAYQEMDTVDSVYNTFQEACKWCIDNGVRMIWDKADQIWELIRAKHFGPKMSNVSHLYTPVNMEFKYLIKQFDINGIDLTLVHNLKEEWIEGKFTGRLIRAGFKETGGLVDTVIDCFYQDGEFGGRVQFCRQNMDLCGVELVGIEWDYDTLIERIFE